MLISDWSSDVCSSDLALLIVVTVGVFILLNRIAQRLYGRLSRLSATSGTLAAFGLLLASILLDALVVAVTWGIGYVVAVSVLGTAGRSEEHTSELQSLMRISYAVFCLKKKKHTTNNTNTK